MLIGILLIAILIPVVPRHQALNHALKPRISLPPPMFLVLIAPHVDILRLALGVFADEQGDGFFDEPLDLSRFVVRVAEVEARDGFGAGEGVVAGAVASFEGGGEGVWGGLFGGLVGGLWECWRGGGGRGG